MENIQEITQTQKARQILESKTDDFNWGTTLVTILIFLVYIGATFYVLMESYT